MSHYTTTSASYILSKYSRSYPSPTPPYAGGQTPAEPEWQHFTNPIMRILLDAKRSPSGELVSMRLKILWNLHTESNDACADQREVVFEDLELLSFSSSSTIHVPDHSLPLKAVYREAVVGIRYLHPGKTLPACQPSYRRFQMMFKDAMNAGQFIDAIKLVCPCKANPPPTQITRQPTMPTPSTLVAGSAQTAQIARQQQTRIVPMFTSPAMSEHTQRNLTTAKQSSVATSLSSDGGAFVTCSETSRKTDHHLNGQQEIPYGNYGRPANSSLPTSSQPSSSDQSIVILPPAVPRSLPRLLDTAATESSRRVDVQSDRSPLFASLSQTPALYELSRADLETLVGRVIREEGFLQLLDSLDSLWKVKGLLGR